MASSGSPAASQSPISHDKLYSQVLNACDKALKGRTNATYQHDKVKEWSEQIITTLLNSLKETHPQIKWFITATLMQGNTTDGTAGPGTEKAGGRGVFIAQGAWWDNLRDGMKSFDLWNEKGEPDKPDKSDKPASEKCGRYVHGIAAKESSEEVRDARTKGVNGEKE